MAGPPIVLAEWRKAPGRPVVLIYGHYDVQPADPLSQWRSPPFEPVVRDGFLYGRGASDDKGQLFAHVKAAEVTLARHGALPVNVIFLIEGEEEIGSPNLRTFLDAAKSRLKADAAVISDTTMPSPDQPGITYSLRGALSLELEVSGPARDLHSGQFGGAVLNPLQALSGMLACLHYANGRIAVAGLYDRVRRLPEAERAFMRSQGRTDEESRRVAGVRRDWGEPGYSFYERTTIRPAITINGIHGGYAGEGSKSIIPSRAVAKLNVRLAPDQRPGEVETHLRRHFAAVTSPQVSSRVKTSMKADPIVIPRNHPVMAAAALDS